MYPVILGLCRPSGNHCKKPQQVTVLLELFAVQDSARAIDDSHPAVHIQLYDSHVRANEVWLPSAGQTKLYPCSMHPNPTDKTAVSSRMYGENGWCRASTFTSATSSARVEPFAVAKLIGVLLTRRFVAFAVFSIPSLIRSCSLPVSTNHTHPSFEAGVATVGKWVLPWVSKNSKCTNFQNLRKSKNLG